MDSDSKTGLYIVAIVAAVALVSIVVMVMSVGARQNNYVAADKADSDLTGQALAAAVPSGSFYRTVLSSKSLWVTDDAHIGSLGGSSNVYVCANANGDLYKSSTPCAEVKSDIIYGKSLSSESLWVTADAHVGNLAGESIAYVCVNSNGDLFRSLTPCVVSRTTTTR